MSATKSVLNLAVGRLLASSLYDVVPWDVATFAGVAAMCTAVALVAIYVPARRVRGVVPALVCRSE
jgi:putative ABC transport system permease protein